MRWHAPTQFIRPWQGIRKRPTHDKSEFERGRWTFAKQYSKAVAESAMMAEAKVAGNTGVSCFAPFTAWGHFQWTTRNRKAGVLQKMVLGRKPQPNEPASRCLKRTPAGSGGWISCVDATAGQACSC